MGQEVKLFGIGLKIPSQCIVRRVVCCIGLEVVEGKVLVLGEGLGGDDVGSFKYAGVAFLFGVDPVATHGLVPVKSDCVEALIQ